MLVVNSSTNIDRPSPDYDGVIVYWNRKKDERSHDPDAGRRGWDYKRQMEEFFNGNGKTDKGSQDKPPLWEWWWENSGPPEPKRGLIPIPGIRVPIRLPPLLPVP